ncbi:MAG: sulfite exporter TauE/SafE family protein, partial [Chloroflexota bacterium]|nr:sulfite exporter TauE/SafE family protein [Chloroflexota bacterium]
MLLVPLLTLAFGYSLTSAVGTSLVCVIATAAGAAAHNVRTGRADARLGIVLAAGTVVGAFTGGFVAGYLPDRLLAGLFALLMLYTAYSLSRGIARRAGDDDEEGSGEPVNPAARDGAGAAAYRERRRGLAVGGSFVAGNVSGLLG